MRIQSHFHILPLRHLFKWCPARPAPQNTRCLHTVMPNLKLRSSSPPPGEVHHTHTHTSCQGRRAKDFVIVRFSINVISLQSLIPVKVISDCCLLVHRMWMFLQCHFMCSGVAHLLRCSSSASLALPYSLQLPFCSLVSAPRSHHLSPSASDCPVALHSLVGVGFISVRFWVESLSLLLFLPVFVLESSVNTQLLTPFLIHTLRFHVRRQTESWDWPLSIMILLKVH